MKIQVEINQIENRKAIEKVNKSKSWIFKTKQNWQTISYTNQGKKMT